MFDYKMGLNEKVGKIHRKAARAIILKDDLLLVMKSDKDEVKLPGGGLEGNETFIEALHREVKEETGYEVIKYEYIGKITESYYSRKNKNEVFNMVSEYYIVDVGKKRGNLNLQGYELEENYMPSFMSLEEVILINEKAVTKNSDNMIARRELYVYKEIYHRIVKNK